MKRLLASILAVLALTSCSSTIKITDANKSFYNFTYQSGTLKWSMVYTYDVGKCDMVKDWYRQNFKVNETKDNEFLAESLGSALPVTECGLKRGWTPILLLSPCVVYSLIEFKEDRCRVTVNKVVWTPDYAITAYSGGIGVSSGAGVQDWGEFAFKNNGYNSTFYNKVAEPLDKQLTYLFQYRLTESNDNW